ncbi:MAG: DUF4349 domain-containing protein [Pseudomonadota bacterium]
MAGTRFTKVSRLAVAASALVLAAACEGVDEAAYVQSVDAEADMVLAERKASSGVSAAPPEQQAEAQAGAMLAYSYSMQIAAPKEAVKPMMSAHQEACMAAGPDVCQILGASTNRWGDDQVAGHLNLRAAPAWLETFRGEIVSDAEKVGGKLIDNTVRAEDLTRYILDMDARLEAKKTLRDRIKNLLETSEGSLSDVLAAERALSDVQGEIDSMTAQLRAARARVAMSSLTISYASDPETSIGLFKPLREAFGDFGRMSVASLADAVRFVAKAWPYFIILMIVLVILRSWWRGRKA